MYVFSSLSCQSRLLRNNSDHLSLLGSMGNPLFNQASSANLRDHGSNALGAPETTSKYKVPHSNISINELHSANALSMLFIQVSSSKQSSTSFPAANAPLKSAPNVVDATLLGMDDIPPWPPPMYLRGLTTTMSELTKTQTHSDLLATLLINVSPCLSRHQNCSSDAIMNAASRPPLSFGVEGVTLAIQVDDISPSIQVLWKHQIACSDTFSGTVNH